MIDVVPLPGRGRACDMALASTHDIKPTPASAPDQTAPDGARLSLDPATTRHAGIHGGWWPRSRDAVAELPGLLTELSSRAGRVSRVAVQAGAFSNIPHQLTVGGRKVHVAWFRYMNPHTVLLTMAGRDDLILLVVPSQASPAAGAEALRLAASSRQADLPEAILAAAGIAADGDPARIQPAENVVRR
jgi:hypothetical protein